MEARHSGRLMNQLFVVFSGYERKFFIGPKQPVYVPGPSTYRSYKPEFENSPAKMVVYLRAGGDILDLKSEFPFQDAQVYDSQGGARFQNRQKLVEAAFKQIEKQLDIICSSGN